MSFKMDGGMGAQTWYRRGLAIDATAPVYSAVDGVPRLTRFAPRASLSGEGVVLEAQLPTACCR